MLRQECGILNRRPSCARDASASVGGLDENLRLAFDYELWMRLPAKASLHCHSGAPGRIRMNNLENITLGKRRQVFQEEHRYLAP